MSPIEAPARSRWVGVGAFALLMAVGVAVALVGVNDTGPLWPDAPRYANAGAMMHDWFASGRLHQPVEFAQENYARYPAFNVPYHPPGCPAALGAWFHLFGVSYLSARLFVAVCWGVSGWLCSRLVRELGGTPAGGLAAGLLLLTTPPLAVWARDTMSEVPSLVPLFAAALFWVRWLNGGRWYHALAAATLIETAFFFRVTTAGVVPGLIVFGLLTRQLRGWRLLWVGGCCVLYLGVNYLWVKFAAQYAGFEMTADGRGSWSVTATADFFRTCAAGAFASGTAAVAAVGVGAAGWVKDGRRLVLFWLCWLGSYLLFKVVMPTSNEVRHLFTAVPALAGLAACAFPKVRRWPAVGLVAAGVALNLWGLWAITPPGVVGFEPVAAELARPERSGNVLLACYEDQELIFRYRAASPHRPRAMIRSDRTLAVRAAEYAHQPDRVIATSPDDVLALVRAGKVGAVVTWTPFAGEPDIRPPDLLLTHDTVSARPDLFRLVGKFPVHVGYVDHIHRTRSGEVWVWEVLGEVGDGPPDVPVVIPTAGMTIRP